MNCGPLTAPSNGEMTGNGVLYASSRHFSCYPGYYISGSVSRTCQLSGLWNGTDAFCSGEDCSEDINSFVQLSKQGDEIHCFVCFLSTAF